eukprot:5741795-Pleurochrysis_carterae.AAC.1
MRRSAGQPTREARERARRSCVIWRDGESRRMRKRCRARNGRAVRNQRCAPLAPSRSFRWAANGLIFAHATHLLQLSTLRQEIAPRQISAALRV